jgi:Tol biopolymer transport system component/DNA-binding SARP family transcriptional activator
MIELRMLGQIQLRAATGEPVESLLRQPKRLALLAYLASPAPGTWHRRDMLLALFWPELDTAHARTSLRNALYTLRQTLGDEVLVTRGDEEISVHPSLIWTDLGTVWDALRNGRTGEALASYGGDLLPGLFPADSDGFMRWLDAERTRLKVALSAAAMTKAEELERGGSAMDALKVVRQVMDLRPDDETVVRRVMALHEANGDRAGALATFETFRAKLAAEFEAEPAPETAALAARLRAPSPVPLPEPAAKLGTDRGTTQEPAMDPRAHVGIGDGGARRSIRPSTSRTLAGAAIVLAAIGVMAVIAMRVFHAARPMTIGTSAPLTADEDLQVEAAISPNGRLVAFAKGNSRRLSIYVQKIGGGPAWRLTSDSAISELLPRWSPDNDAVLFLARNNAYVAPAIGGASRVIARGDAGDAMVRSAAWSPTGDSIVIVRNDSLMVQPVTGSGVRVIVTAGGRQLHSCVWSPNNRWIACDAGNWLAFEPGPLFGNEAPSAIVLAPVAGGKLVELTGNAFQHRSPAWSADGDFLWLLSDRDGNPGEAYAIRVGDDGRALGPWVRAGLNAESIDLSRKRIVYSVPVRRANIWSVPIPGDQPLALSTAGTRITSGRDLIELVNASADGKWLVYDSNLYGNADIFRIPIGGGPVERLTNDSRPEYAGAVSPDGRDLEWQRGVNPARRLFPPRLDRDSAQEISIGPGDQGVPKWSPDGRSLAAWSHIKEEGAVFVMHRDEHGSWQRPAWRLEGGQLPVWSRDGRMIAFTRYSGGIGTIPADSGAVRSVYTPRPQSSDPIAAQLVWSLDQSTIWFIGSDAKGHGGIWSVPASGGSARLRVDLDDRSGRAHGPSITTDGSRFYFTLDERFSTVRWADLVSR